MPHNVSLRRIGDMEASFIVRNFEEFYTEIIRQKQRILQEVWLPSATGDSALPTDDDHSVRLGAAEINNKLARMLEAQALDASERGGEFATRYYHEAQYIMAALADEVFLTLNWKGRDYWEDHLIESRFFGTHEAGDLFFKRLEEFLANRDPVQRDLAEVYLLALGLGFEGKYRGASDHRRLTYYRHELYSFITRRELKFFQEHERVFPEAYIYTLEQGNRKMMQDKRLWYTAFLAAFLVVLAFSHVMWRQGIGDIDRTATSIIAESFN
jgi:type VI secretion system protein ImpK